MVTNRDLENKLFDQRDKSIRHSSFESEMKYYNDIASGRMPEYGLGVDVYLRKDFGVLSDNAIRNIRYHLIISIALITRFCVEKGMDLEVAYSLSDLYIQRADKSNTIEELDDLKKEMTSNFCNRMKTINRGVVYSKPIVICLDYIYNNLQEKITLNDLCQQVNLSAQYLSNLFHKEVGLSFKEYLISKRIESAANMLKFTDMSSVEISNYLNFSSHSYFIKLFREHIGTTPKQYRNDHFRNSLANPDNK